MLARWATDYQCSANDVFALLEHVGTDVAGAAQYLPPGTAADEAAPGQFDPLTEADVETLLHTVREDATAWHPRPLVGRWSLAGARRPRPQRAPVPGRGGSSRDQHSGYESDPLR